ncbi:hypothetical protein HXA34_20545 [Salipaludibacillus agaradhaerens]|uniref:hypothetical protein n=1 Tax=Salipaludibacillus agaradhaerens TaxID=76935 RepID=UPI002151951E|nr:hypothetical protein [Salipaludibacillus agaradhaerens]MCR6108689.1 hypothetical protein [Salipaludibacillus agaradhaerens]MCR6120712.1 hypothetical protein [Salipaludibacillus agaradhaerens]
MDYLINIVVSLVGSGGIAFAIVKFTAEGKIDYHFKKKLQEHENNLAIATEREKVKYQKDIHQYTLYSNTRHEIIPELYQRALWAKEKTSILNGGYITPGFGRIYQDKHKVLREFENSDQKILEDVNDILEDTDQNDVLKRLNRMYERKILSEASKSINSYSQYLFLNALFIEDNIFDCAGSLRVSLLKLHRNLTLRTENEEKYWLKDKASLAEDITAAIDKNIEELKSLCKKEISRT